MRKGLLAYTIYGGSLLTLYGVGGFTGWWKAMHLAIAAASSRAYNAGGPTGTGTGHGIGYGGGGSSGYGGGGGGFRGGK